MPAVFPDWYLCRHEYYGSQYLREDNSLNFNDDDGLKHHRLWTYGSSESYEEVLLFYNGGHRAYIRLPESPDLLFGTHLCSYLVVLNYDFSLTYVIGAHKEFGPVSEFDREAQTTADTRTWHSVFPLYSCKIRSILRETWVSRQYRQNITTSHHIQ